MELSHHDALNLRDDWLGEVEYSGNGAPPDHYPREDGSLCIDPQDCEEKYHE